MVLNFARVLTWELPLLRTSPSSDFQSESKAMATTPRRRPVSRTKVTGGSHPALGFFSALAFYPMVWLMNRGSTHQQPPGCRSQCWELLRLGRRQILDRSLVVPSAASTSELPIPTLGLPMKLSLILCLPCRTFTAPSISRIWGKANFYNKSLNPIILSMFLFLWLAPVKRRIIQRKDLNS